LIYLILVGTWRRLVAHLNGVQGVGGSNPLVPTRNFKGLALGANLFFIACTFPVHLRRNSGKNCWS
jgi:hypothetical protein